MKRQVRQTIETRLAKEILGDALKSGDTVEIDYDKETGDVKFNKVAAPAETKSSKRATKAAAPAEKSVE